MREKQVHEMINKCLDLLEEFEGFESYSRLEKEGHQWYWKGIPKIVDRLLEVYYPNMEWDLEESEESDNLCLKHYFTTPNGLSIRLKLERKGSVSAYIRHTGLSFDVSVSRHVYLHRYDDVSTFLEDICKEVKGGLHELIHQKAIQHIHEVVDDFENYYSTDISFDTILNQT